ncbi:MAG: MmgE/PrpD family protein [Deltaproteobacteria bacterium]|nr:MmgE/PrpD family protein [Deltaproteobacteria bacterium]
MNVQPTAAQRLAQFICQLKYGEIPAAAVSRCKDLLLDQLGCQLIGSLMPWNQPVYRFVKANKSGGPARIVKTGEPVPLDDAVLVNGTYAQGCELDDYYDQGGGHPGAASVPVILALAEQQPVSGQELVTALVAGCEVGWRVGRALLPELMRRGYHAQSAVGVFIAAAAAGKILRLDAEQMTHALAIAGSHAGGTMEYDQSGGEVKRVHNGMACCGGLRSAMLAQVGLTGPPTIFEGERGILKVMSGACNVEPLVKDLAVGDHLGIYHAAMKRFPVNASQHAPIELLDKIIRANGIAAKQVVKITAGVNEGILLHGGTIYEPQEVIEAQFSLRFSLALRLLKGNNDLQNYLDEKLWHDAAMLDIGRKIDLIADPNAVGPRRFACAMTIDLNDGRQVSDQLAAPKGNYRNPLTREELVDKFNRLGRGALGQDRLTGIVESVAVIENAPNVASLCGSMVAA